jgi:hypothetical protein
MENSETPKVIEASRSFESSPGIMKLFEALSKAQAEIKPAVLDMVNPFYNNSRYASLTSCQEAYRGPLSKHGLCLIQQVFSQGAEYFIRSILGHVSGEWISNTFKLLIDKNNMQGLGSAITYGRRYGANSLIGVVDTEDDDGNSASKSNAKPPPPPSPPPSAKPKSNPEPNKISEPQRKRLFAILDTRGWTHEQCKFYISIAFQLESTKDLNISQYDKLISVIETKDYVQAIKELGGKNG